MKALIKNTAAGARSLLRQLGVRGSFEPTHFVWSRGLALLCDHNGGLNNVRNQRGARAALALNPAAYAQVRDGDLVWTRITALPQFVEQVLPHIRARFALVSGDEDWSIPSQLTQADAICRNPNLVCWFTQNYDGTDRSGKILPLPIGLDFHTISNGRRWGHARATPREQELILDVLRAAMPANQARLLRVHADFHLNKHRRSPIGESRESVEAALRTNALVDFQHEKVSRLDLWREKMRYAFVVSPHGNGLDCHRTWESLALGNIVIVKHSPLDPLYEQLPVVMVDHWQQITAANLQTWQRQHCQAFGDPQVQQRLTNSYWIERARAILKQRMAPASRATSLA